MTIELSRAILYLITYIAMYLIFFPHFQHKRFGCIYVNYQTNSDV